MARIFLSSRFQEFKELRNMLTRRLPQQPGFTVVNLDDSLAASTTARDRSLSGVAVSDCLLLLLGTTYAEPSDELSLTELEYERALELGIRVMAFSRPQPDPTEPRVGRFLRRVQDSFVVGRLHAQAQGQDDIDADHICSNVVADLGTLGTDETGRESALAQRLRGELDYLGVANLEDWRQPNGLSGERPTFTLVAELRNFASRALAHNDLAEARDRLAEAHAKHSNDWLTGYLYARLLELRGLRSDVDLARDAIKRSVRTVDRLADAPQTLPSEREARARRLCASWLIDARLARRAHDYQGAADAAELALRAQDYSEEARVERLLAVGALHKADPATDAATSLLHMYPDTLIRTLGAAELSPIRDQLEGGLAGEVSRRHLEAARTLRRKPPDTLHRGVSAALWHYREMAEDERARVGRALRQLLPLVCVDGPTTWQEKAQENLQRTTQELHSATSRAAEQRTLVLSAMQGLDLMAEALTPTAVLGLLTREATAAGEMQKSEERRVQELAPRRPIRWTRVGCLIPLGVFLGAPLLGALIGSFSSARTNQILEVSGALVQAGSALLAVFVTAYVVMERVRRRLREKAAGRLASTRERVRSVEGLVPVVRGWGDCESHLAKVRRVHAMAEEDAEARHRELAAVMTSLNLPTHTTFGGLESALRQAVLRFDEAFATYPRWAFPKSRSRFTSREGCLVLAKSQRASGGWLEGAPARFVLTYRDAGRLLDSDIGVFLGEFHPRAAALESVLRRFAEATSR